MNTSALLVFFGLIIPSVWANGISSSDLYIYEPSGTESDSSSECSASSDDSKLGFQMSS